MIRLFYILVENVMNYVRKFNATYKSGYLLHNRDIIIITLSNIQIANKDPSDCASP